MDGDILELECYKSTGKAGWCGTCKSSAKKGNPGYCGEDAATEESDKKRRERERPRPTGWGGWGFCDPICRQLDFSGYGLETFFSMFPFKMY